MADTDLPNLPALIGTERFSTFLSATGGSHEAAVRLYSWNMDASASLWGDLHVLEIVLRNGLHHRLARLFNRPDWWNADVLKGRDRRPVDDAITAIRRRHPRDWTAGHVVAELGFGFWIGLLANRHHTTLWTTALCEVFRHFEGRRGDIHAALERLRKLRNRIAHHEPIFGRDLAYDHRMILSVLEYISSDASAWCRTRATLAPILKVSPL
jgi:hypothetical protein